MLLRGGMYSVYMTAHLHMNGGTETRPGAREARTRESPVVTSAFVPNFSQNLILLQD